PIALGPSADHPVLRHALDIGADRFWSSARHGLVVGRKQAAFDTAAFQYALAASPARSPHLRAAPVDAGVELDAAVNDDVEQQVLSRARRSRRATGYSSSPARSGSGTTRCRTTPPLSSPRPRATACTTATNPSRASTAATRSSSPSAPISSPTPPPPRSTRRRSSRATR